MPEETRTRTGVKHKSENNVEAILRWLGQVERKTGEDVVIRTWKMEVSGRRKIGKQKTEVERCFTKRPEGEGSAERRSTRTEKMENENFMRRPQIWKGLKKK